MQLQERGRIRAEGAAPHLLHRRAPLPRWQAGNEAQLDASRARGRLQPGLTREDGGREYIVHIERSDGESGARLRQLTRWAWCVASVTLHVPCSDPCSSIASASSGCTSPRVPRASTATDGTPSITHGTRQDGDAVAAGGGGGGVSGGEAAGGGRAAGFWGAVVRRTQSVDCSRAGRGNRQTAACAGRQRLVFKRNSWRELAGT